MGYKNLDLLSDVVSVYDQNKTTIAGRVSQKTVNGDLALGPSIPCFMDVFTDTAIVPSGVIYTSSVVTGDIVRVFMMGTPVAGSVSIIMYNHNIKLGTSAYVGRLQVRSPNIIATTVFKGLEVQDTGVTGWKIWLSMTNAVLINGGLSLINKVDLTDFTPLGSIIFDPATGNDQKASYLLQDPANIGVNQLNVASNGVILDSAANRMYVHNGVAATHQFYVYDTSIAPTFLESTITGTNANPGVFTLNSHGFLLNDPVLFKTTGAYSGLVNNTVYFARDITPNTFNLSLTSGGAAISTVGTQSGVHSIGRAFGATGSNWVHKTGNLPALVGTLLSNNSENLATPQHASYGALVGQNCAAFTTTTNLYMGRLSELNSGVITWPSLTTSNILGTLNEVVAPTATFAQFSNVLDMFVFISNTSLYYGKRLVNNEFQFKGGRLNTAYYEGLVVPYGTARFGAVTVTGFQMGAGIATIVGGTTGQRGVLNLDMSQDDRFGRDFIVSKVLDTPNSVLKTISVIDELVNTADNYNIYYRTSGFGSISGGWLPFDEADLSSLNIDPQIQLKFTFSTLRITSQTASQISDATVNTESNDDISDNWEYSHDSSSNLSPTRVAFRLRFGYSAGTVPLTLRFRSYDLSGTLLVNQTITSNPSNFEYSTNNGSTWLPLGTIPNTVGTLIRYTFSSPPGVDIRPALKNE
jgi:hypothetical protein